jgi:transcriptional regulator with XRE-family HTH domain
MRAAMTRTMTGTGASAGEIQDYTAVSRRAQTHTLSLEADYLRTQSDLVNIEIESVHERAREMDLANRALAKSRNDVPNLLDELAYRRGMAWTHIAEIADVSVSAVRKWRKGHDASPESRSRLAKFAALLDVLEQRGRIQDPANWMEMDLPLGAGYHIRPLDLYLNGQDAALLDIAERRRRVEHVLDYIRPGWRDIRSKFEVFEDADGVRSMRIRSE